MRKLWASIQKESWILIRDRAGIAVLFIMPLLMICIMALIQDAPFRDYQEIKIPILLASEDEGNLYQSLVKGMGENGFFEIKRMGSDSNALKMRIQNGEFDIGIYIPEKASLEFDRSIHAFVDSKLNPDSLNTSDKNPGTELKVFSAPARKKSVRVLVGNFNCGFNGKI